MGDPIDLAAIEARPTAFVPARGVALTEAERDALAAVVRAAAALEHEQRTTGRITTLPALRDALARFDMGASGG